MPAETKLKLTPSERRASVALAGLFAARMLGLFLLLPVFAVAARGRGDDPARVGLALGMYGLTQAFMQIPFGLASDRWGRRPVVIAGLLLFVAAAWSVPRRRTCSGSPSARHPGRGRHFRRRHRLAGRRHPRRGAHPRHGHGRRLDRPVLRRLAGAVARAGGLVGLSGLFWTIACLGVVCLAGALGRAGGAAHRPAPCRRPGRARCCCIPTCCG